MMEPQQARDGGTPLTQQLMRYAITGVVNVAIDVGLLDLGVWKTGLHKGPLFLAMASFSFLCAVANSYIWNGHWTFRARLNVRAQALPFLGVNLVGLGLNDGIIGGLTAIPHPWLGTSPVLHVDEAKVVAILVTALWNFVGLRQFVFRPRHLRPHASADRTLTLTQTISPVAADGPGPSHSGA